MPRKKKSDQKPVPWQQFECSFILSLLKEGVADKLRGRLWVEGDRLLVRCDSPEHSMDLRVETYGPLLYAVTELEEGVTPVRSVVYRCLAYTSEVIDREVPLYWMAGQGPRRKR